MMISKHWFFEAETLFLYNDDMTYYKTSNIKSNTDFTGEGLSKNKKEILRINIVSKVIIYPPATP